MSNYAMAARLQYVDAVTDDGIVYENDEYGIVTDDYDTMEVMDFDTPEDPHANVRKAVEIAETINASEKWWGIRDWWHDNVTEDNEHHYYMKGD